MVHFPSSANQRSACFPLAISSYQQFERLRTGLLTWGEANRTAMTSATIVNMIPEEKCLALFFLFFHCFLSLLANKYVPIPVEIPEGASKVFSTDDISKFDGSDVSVLDLGHIVILS